MYIAKVSSKSSGVLDTQWKKTYVCMYVCMYIHILPIPRPNKPLHMTTAPDMAQLRVVNSLHQTGLATEGDIAMPGARRPPPQVTRRQTRALAM